MRNHHKLLHFKRFYLYLLLLPFVLTLYACPFSSNFKLENEAVIPTDESLLGNWATMVTNNRGKEQPVKMILGKKNETEYTIDFAGYLNDLEPYQIVNNDSIKGSAFMSNIANRNFLNIEIKGQTYIAEVILKNNKLSILPLAERFTSKYIKSSADLRTAVEFHVKTRVTPTYDDLFCLKEMVRVN